MKKFLAMLLLVAILASCTIALADCKRVKSSSYVYKKAGSGKTNVMLKKGSIVDYLGKKGKWAKVEYLKGSGTKTGWVLKKNLGYTDKEDLESYFASGGKGSSTSNEDETSASGTVKTTGKVTMRSESSLSGKSLKSIKKGVKLKYKAVATDDRGVYWIKVTYKGKTGWISTKYVKKVK